MDRSDRKDVKDAAFDVVLRGYDRRQVDQRLRFLGSQLAAAENALRTASQQTATLEDALSEARSAPGGEPSGQVDQMSLLNFGARVEKILTLAQDEAREVRSEAEEAAAALVEQARAQAAEQRQRAEQEIAAWRTEAASLAAERDSALQLRCAELDSARLDVESMRPEAERESERIRAQALAEADQSRKSVAAEVDQIRKSVAAEVDQIRKSVAAEVDELSSAAAADADRVAKVTRAEADQVLAQARAEAQRLVAVATETAQQRERSSAHELHQLSRLRDEINADLYRAKEVLDGLFGQQRAVRGPAAQREVARSQYPDGADLRVGPSPNQPQHLLRVPVTPAP